VGEPVQNSRLRPGFLIGKNVTLLSKKINKIVSFYHEQLHAWCFICFCCFNPRCNKIIHCNKLHFTILKNLVKLKKWKITLHNIQYKKNICRYSWSRLMWSLFGLSAAYCDKITKAPFAEHYNRLLYKNLAIVIIQLMFSVSLGPKLITSTVFNFDKLLYITYVATTKGHSYKLMLLIS